MLAAALLAGFLAAHAVWSISDGETLIPIYGYIDASGARHLVRLAESQSGKAVETGRDLLDANPNNVACAGWLGSRW